MFSDVYIVADKQVVYVYDAFSDIYIVADKQVVCLWCLFQIFTLWQINKLYVYDAFSDIYIVADEEDKQWAMKLHRYFILHK